MKQGLLHLQYKSYLEILTLKTWWEYVRSSETTRHHLPAAALHNSQRHIAEKYILVSFQTGWILHFYLFIFNVYPGQSVTQKHTDTWTDTLLFVNRGTLPVDSCLWKTEVSEDTRSNARARWKGSNCTVVTSEPQIEMFAGCRIRVVHLVSAVYLATLVLPF